MNKTLNPAIVRINKILPPEGTCPFSLDKLKKAGETIFNLGGVITPIIVRRGQTGQIDPEVYEVVDGLFQYYAALEAQKLRMCLEQKNFNINVYIVEDDDQAKLFQQQIEIFRNAEPKTEVADDSEPKTEVADDAEPKTEVANDAEPKVKTSHAVVMVEDIISSVPHTKFPPEALEKAAKAILNADGVITPPILLEKGIDSFEVIDGNFEYHAAKKASELDPIKGETINAFVVKGNNEQIEEQIKIFRQPSATPSKPKVGAKPKKADSQKRITTKAGNPFKTAAAAKAQRTRRKLTGYEVIQIKGGWALECQT